MTFPGGDGGGGGLGVTIISVGGSGYKTWGTTTTKKKKKGRSSPAQNPADPYNLVGAKTTTGHKAAWDGTLGHYKYS